MKKASKRRILFAARMATMVGAVCFAVSGISETLGQEKEKSRPVYIATEEVAETTYMPEIEETTQPTETAKAVETEEPLIASMDWDKDDSYLLYRYDLENNKKGSKWTTDFEAMALKTVIKMLLSKWGILSVDMQRAIQDDQKVYDEDGDGSYGDNQPDIVEAQDPFDKIEQKEEEQQIGGLDLEEVE